MGTSFTFPEQALGLATTTSTRYVPIRPKQCAREDQTRTPLRALYLAPIRPRGEAIAWHLPAPEGMGPSIKLTFTRSPARGEAARVAAPLDMNLVNAAARGCSIDWSANKSAIRLEDGALRPVRGRVQDVALRRLRAREAILAFVPRGTGRSVDYRRIRERLPAGREVEPRSGMASARRSAAQAPQRSRMSCAGGRRGCAVASRRSVSASQGAVLTTRCNNLFQRVSLRQPAHDGLAHRSTRRALVAGERRSHSYMRPIRRDSPAKGRRDPTWLAAQLARTTFLIAAGVQEQKSARRARGIRPT